MSSDVNKCPSFGDYPSVITESSYPCTGGTSGTSEGGAAGTSKVMFEDGYVEGGRNLSLGETSFFSSNSTSVGMNPPGPSGCRESWQCVVPAVPWVSQFSTGSTANRYIKKVGDFCCRHAALECLRRYLINIAGYPARVVNQLIPYELYNNQEGFIAVSSRYWATDKDKFVKPDSTESFNRVVETINRHLDNNLPIIAYVQASGRSLKSRGRHAVVIVGRTVIDGRPAYIFLEPGTKRADCKIGYLVYDETMGNFVRLPQKGKGVSAARMYSLAAVFSYVDDLNRVADRQGMRSFGEFAGN